MDLQLSGKHVLITGASMGIGAHLAQTFAAENAHLHLTARSTDKLEELKKQIMASHDVKVSLYSSDLAQTGACEALSEAVGSIDILVNNAGAIPSGSLWDVDEEAWRKGWDLKVMGYINLCRLFYKKMQHQGACLLYTSPSPRDS